ncbi:hypothetical protein D3C80_178940 [compost metagenome]
MVKTKNKKIGVRIFEWLLTAHHLWFFLIGLLLLAFAFLIDHPIATPCLGGLSCGILTLLWLPSFNMARRSSPRKDADSN